MQLILIALQVNSWSKFYVNISRYMSTCKAISSKQFKLQHKKLYMRSLLVLFFLLPILALCQTKKTVKSKLQTKAPAVEGYIITGNISGYPNGTAVSFLNEQTNTPELQTRVSNGSFVIKGRIDRPSIKGLIFNNEAPLVPIFLDNSNIKITGSKEHLDQLTISGSPSHDQYKAYISSIQPYEQALSPDAPYDPAVLQKLTDISERFVRTNPESYVSALAIIRFYQATQDGIKTQELYQITPPRVQFSDMGNYAYQLILESKINPIGSVITNFTETDTAGNRINIAAYRGKYVLLDFWASWCRPCRQENPNVVAAFEKYKNKNFTIVGISLDQNKKAWLDAIKMDQLNWSHLSDLKGWSSQVAAIFKVSSIPQNFLLDPEGRIIAKNLRGGALDGRLNVLLK